MTSQREDTAVRGLREIPPEVSAQLVMNLELLDAADAYYAAWPEDFKLHLALMSPERAHEQFVAALATLPPATRDRIRRCVGFLAELVEEISRPRTDADEPAPLTPVGAVLQLPSSPGYAATA